MSTRTRRISAALVAALALPAVIAMAATVSTADRIEGARALPAAVVNLDEPVTTGQGKEKQTIAAGRLLAAGLTRPAKEVDPGMDWTLTDAETAADGLAAGTFHAVVTIGETFSADVAKISTDNPRQAGVDVRTDDATATVVGTITTDVTEIAADTLGRMVTTTYLSGLYAKTSELGGQIGDAADGAEQLNDGATQLGGGLAALGGGASELSDGARSAADGATQLRDGAKALDSGAATLARGSKTLASGNRQLDGGLESLTSGASSLAKGADGLSAGAAEVNTGAQQLATGLGTLRKNTTEIGPQSRALAEGAEQVSNGVQGWSTVLRGWGQACANPTLAAAAAELCAGTRLALGADNANVEALVSGAAALAEGAGTFADSAPALRAGIVKAADGSSELAAGTAQLDSGSTTLVKGASALSGGAAQAKGAASKLASGSSKLASGASDLSTGTGELRSGATQLADGTSRLSGGTDELKKGTSELAEGAGQLTEGSSALADGLRKGAEQVPTTDAEQQQANAEAVARPVVARSTDGAPSNVRSEATGNSAALALWLGAFATFLAIPALAQSRLAAAGTARGVVVGSLLPALAVGVGQVLLVLGGVWALGLEVHSPWLLGLLVLPVVALTALTTSQAVLAVCGERSGGVVLLALTAVQALALPGFLPLDAAPGWLQSANGLLPVPLAADLVQWAVTGSGSATAVVGLLVLASAGFLVSTWAASRRSHVPVSAVRRQAAGAA